MPPEIVEAIAPLIATFTLLGGTLVGLRMYWNYKTRRLEIEAAKGSGPLEDAVEELRAEVHQLRGELGELHERVDFAERLLARGGGEQDAIDRPH